MPLWAAYGCSFNSVMLISSDFVDVMFASQFGLSPLAAAGLMNTALAAGGLAGLQILPGVLDMPDRATEGDAFRAKLQGRIFGIIFGFTVGLWPLFWPEEWRLWKAGAAATKANIQAPPTDEELQLLKICDQHYPSGMEGPRAEQIIHAALAERGWTKEDTLFAHATCPDEVNYDEEEDIMAEMTKRWGKRFSLGGLGGMPFSGRTGWAAFGGHTPENAGHILVLYAPHVGVGNNGNVGKIRRQGQSHDTTCCGAAVAAYGTEKLPSGDDWITDMEQFALTKLLQPFKKAIKAHPTPMKGLSYANFEVSHELLRQQLTQPERFCSEIAVVGGIMVNLPGNLHDHFVPMTFEVLNCKTGEIKDEFAKFGVEPVKHIFGTATVREPFFGKAAMEIKRGGKAN